MNVVELHPFALELLSKHVYRGRLIATGANLLAGMVTGRS
jgi:hypothetical protein